MRNRTAIPIIDLFAGPGGLGEGFSSYRDKNQQPAFKIKLSIEKDRFAHQTLQLRSFYRQFEPRSIPEDYYSLLRRTDIPIDARIEMLYASYPKQAQNAQRESWLAELGKENAETVHQRVSEALQGSERWVLIGGPPCQAYSVVGRVRNKGKKDYVAEEDQRHFLYKEYLQVLADHKPAVFVMENVRGLLSASVGDGRIFQRILDDLRDPPVAIKHGRIHLGGSSTGIARYRIFSLTERGLFEEASTPDFIVRMERHGIPQARHRLILIGVRDDLGSVQPELLDDCDPVAVECVLYGLPRLRSGLSRQVDGAEAWCQELQHVREQKWLKKAPKAIRDELLCVLDGLTLPPDDRGGEYIEQEIQIEYKPEWFLDDRIQGVWNHETRGHIVEDLYRYLYAACFAKVTHQSPDLHDFPPELLPAHNNVQVALDEGMFDDRFRVQVASKPATTITSHISKDGHYYIHPDASQCRSLTVREAARIQTFPDNYFFCGPRTAQYTQVGNAVPPMLAYQIAQIVAVMLE